MKQYNVITTKHTRIAIIASGSIDASMLPEVRKANLVIGVDRGAWWLIEKRIVPDIAIGDFDSVSASQKKKIHDIVPTYIEYPPNKDATDLELAIGEAVKRAPKEVRMYGALGVRFDHSVAALHMLLKLESHNICGYLVDKNNSIHIVRHRSIIRKSSKFPYVSILPVTKTATISLSGFVYNLSRFRIHQGSTRTISNELTKSNANITVHSGRIIVIQSKD